MDCFCLDQKINGDINYIEVLYSRFSNCVSKYSMLSSIYKHVNISNCSKLQYSQRFNIVEDKFWQKKMYHDRSKSQH